MLFTVCWSSWALVFLVLSKSVQLNVCFFCCLFSHCSHVHGDSNLFPRQLLGLVNKLIGKKIPPREQKPESFYTSELSISLFLLPRLNLRKKEGVGIKRPKWPSLSFGKVQVACEREPGFIDTAKLKNRDKATK